MNHDDVQVLAVEYLLGHTDEVTRARMAAHLTECASCRADVREVARALDGVGRSVPVMEPPASLRARVMAIPAATPQSAPLAHVAAPQASWTRLVPWVVAAAASVVAAVALWQNSVINGEVEQLRQQVADARISAGQAQIVRASLEAQVETFSREAVVLRSSDLMAYTLVGSAGASAAHARAYVTHKQGMVFTAEGLPTLPAGKVYQLWVIVGNAPVSAGVFAPDASGRVHAVMGTPDITAMPSAVAVTVEPQGGLAQPSTTPILVGTPK